MGLFLVPLNYRLARREIAYQLGDANPALVIVEEKFAQNLPSEMDGRRVPLWRMEALSAWWEAQDETESRAELRPQATVKEDDPILILYTSGTTGLPKGAIYTHKMLFWNSINTAMRLNITSDDRTINFAPLFHTGGWNVLATPLLHHGAYFGMLKKFDAGEILRLAGHGYRHHTLRRADDAQNDFGNAKVLFR